MLSSLLEIYICIVFYGLQWEMHIGIIYELHIGISSYYSPWYGEYRQMHVGINPFNNPSHGFHLDV